LVPGITAVEVVSTIPNSGNFLGRIVYLTADGGGFTKGLYRWTDPTATSGTVYWQQPVGNDTIVNDQLTVGCITAGSISAGAVQASAIGANLIITNTANVANAIITSAMIASVSAGAIVAGTIAATVALASSLISTASAYYDVATGTSSTFPGVGMVSNQFSMAYIANSSPNVDSTGILFYGSATTSGFNGNTCSYLQARFFISGSLFTHVTTNYRFAYRISGGAWVGFGALLASPSSMSAAINVSMAATDTIEFGIEYTQGSSPSGVTLNNNFMTVLSFNT